MKEHSVNKKNNFIAGWYLDDTSICDRLIDYFKKNPNKTPGKSAFNGNNGVYKHLKDSIDVAMTDGPELLDYMGVLQMVCQEYIKKYPYCNNYAAWGINEIFQIQYYKPNGGYLVWHTERAGAKDNSLLRHLVFMTYLNTVTDRGETEFYHQQVKIKPKKGLTLIWPADWTFTHRGLPSFTQEKYVVTGWLSF